ncbi:ShlB/FhaC/HecB family hemolysin secretion/activation protein [Roseateles toxinivorans]|uniref:ShlB/FhaC/HecB family hemolysin secretion/activation protein n=1 Tax=Roseateles toxinivorans TaxID=270368 RepID=UPI0010614C60|nr:ShlB/FhaC/HecB family hemolysin secretion/activation protein [Roseateles toxinivorans]
MVSQTTQAQTPTDAGRLLQQQDESRKPVAPPPRSAPLQAKPAEALRLQAGTQVWVKQFELLGNQLIDSARLQAELAPFTARSLSLAELQAATARVSEVYARDGWLVRCYLPPQDVTDGLIRLQIVEARFGGARVEGETRRFEAARALVEAQQTVGAPLRLPALDRALLLLDDLPGLSVGGSLAAGEREGDTLLVLRLTDTPLFSGEAGLDNGGARSTGTARLNASLGLNSLFGRGDLLGASLSHSRGSDYLRLSASLPVGAKGWRVGTQVSAMRYRLVGSEFEALQASGSSQTWGFNASFPLLRGRTSNLMLQLGAEQRRFDNRANGAVTTRYDSTQVSAGLSGNRFDDWGGGGVNQAGLIISRGRLDLGRSPGFAADAQSTRSHGGYGKLRYNLSREQRLSGELSAYLGLIGQWSGDNLDSSEKFYLGGADGVRAYPASEAGGRSGQLITAELRTQFGGAWRASAFYDWGQVSINARNDFVGAPQLNRYALKGAGLSLAWSGPRALELRASLARRIGTNPGASANGRDQDGSLHRNRLWLQASLPF